MTQINTSQLFSSSQGFDYTLNGLNTVSNYLLGDFILIALFLLVLFMLRDNIFSDALISSSVITLLLSLALFASGFIDFTRVVVCFSVFLGAIGMSYLKE